MENLQINNPTINDDVKAFFGSAEPDSPTASLEFERNFTEVQADEGGQVINVEAGQDIQAAIDSANNGDVVRLGEGTFNVESLFIDKDITLDGVEGSVIDGGGTEETLITLGQNASGATLQDFELTNAKNGIYSDGSDNLTINNLDINNIGLGELTDTSFGANNTAILVANTSGTEITNNSISDIGRLGITVKVSDGGDILVDGNRISNVNRDGLHSQSHDAGGIKLFDTTDVTVSNNELFDINAQNIWADTVNLTTITGNEVEIAEDVFNPFNDLVGNGVMGIYNEKSWNAVISGNSVKTETEGDFAIRSTEANYDSLSEFDNLFVGPTDFKSETYWADEAVERDVALGNSVFEDFSETYINETLNG